MGADVGGTWIRIAAVEGDRVATHTIPAHRDLRQLSSVLRSVWRRRQWNRRRVAALVVASRALWTARERRMLAASLRGLARRVAVVSDAQAALLGALGNRPGVLVLSGTGSIVLAYDGHGRWARAGGLGPLVGDEGSGFWLGREWLRAAVRGRALFPTLRLVHGPDPVAAIAALAPRVLERARLGNRSARRIVQEGQRHLAASALEVARRLALRPPVAASWAGSVLGHPWFRAGVIRATRHAGLQARWHEPETSPVVAALRLAWTLAHRGNASGKSSRADRAGRGTARRR